MALKEGLVLNLYDTPSKMIHFAILTYVQTPWLCETASNSTLPVYSMPLTQLRSAVAGFLSPVLGRRTLNRKQQMTHPVDKHVGKKIRQRRWLVGMTQQQLAAEVGIKFQQIQMHGGCKFASVNFECPEKSVRPAVHLSPQPTTTTAPISLLRILK